MRENIQTGCFQVTCADVSEASWRLLELPGYRRIQWNRPNFHLSCEPQERFKQSPLQRQVGQIQRHHEPRRKNSKSVNIARHSPWNRRQTPGSLGFQVPNFLKNCVHWGIWTVSRLVWNHQDGESAPRIDDSNFCAKAERRISKTIWNFRRSRQPPTAQNRRPPQNRLPPPPNRRRMNSP